VVGIAGAASGGDILLHEACMARSIRNLVYLALPEDDFAKESVNDGGDEWINRLYALIAMTCPSSASPKRTPARQPADAGGPAEREPLSLQRRPCRMIRLAHPFATRHRQADVVVLHPLHDVPRKNLVRVEERP
jgi:hypothetical protein